MDHCVHMLLLIDNLYMVAKRLDDCNIYNAKFKDLGIGWNFNSPLKHLSARWQHLS